MPYSAILSLNSFVESGVPTTSGQCKMTTKKTGKCCSKLRIKNQANYRQNTPFYFVVEKKTVWDLWQKKIRALCFGWFGKWTKNLQKTVHENIEYVIKSFSFQPSYSEPFIQLLWFILPTDGTSSNKMWKLWNYCKIDSEEDGWWAHAGAFCELPL